MTDKFEGKHWNSKRKARRKNTEWWGFRFITMKMKTGLKKVCMKRWEYRAIAFFLLVTVPFFQCRYQLK